MNIEGKNAVGEALRAGTTIDVLLVEKGTNHPLVAQARAAGIKIQFVDRSVLERESVSKRHQGFIARATNSIIARWRIFWQKAKDAGRTPLW